MRRSLDDLEANLVEVPQCLIEIRDWLRSKNFPSTQGSLRYTATWVRLDASAHEQPDLPVYDW